MTAIAISPDYTLNDFKGPTVIHSEKQNEHYISVLEVLERRSGKLSKAESRLTELLTLLITEYEERSYRLRPSTPLQVVAELMRANKLRQKDLADVFGTESIVSEVLNGKRELNKDHIKRLSKRFSVSPELFF